MSPSSSAGLRAVALTVLLVAAGAGGAASVPAVETVDAETSTQSHASTAVDSCRVIDSPGHYELATDLENASTCITVSASNVTLDGNGHTIAGTGSAADTAVLVRETNGAGTATNVTVQNIQVEDWKRGVAFRLTNDVTARDVAATDASIVLNHVDGGTVTGSQVENGTVTAVTSWNVSVRDSTLRNSSIELGPFVHGGTVTGVDGEEASVTVDASDNVTVRDNDLSGVSLSDVDDVVVAGNGPDESGRFGVWVDSLGAGSVIITENHITGNDAENVHNAGIRSEAVHDLTVTDNRIEGNDVGVRIVSVADRTTHAEVCGETVTRTEDGTVVLQGNTYVDNTEDVENETEQAASPSHA